MEGSREKLLYTRQHDRNYDTYDTRSRYDSVRHERPPRLTSQRTVDHREDYRPRRNGYVTDDIYSDYDVNQGRLSLFRPIRPEYLNLPSTHEPKYNSLPRSYYSDERYKHRYKKDYYDFRIETEHMRAERNSYESQRRQRAERLPLRKNVAVCKPIRLPQKLAQYWSTDDPRAVQKPRKPDHEPKKNVKFSEVSGCRETIVDDPVNGRTIVPVRELEVSLDQMIQNGYFEKHNIPITRPLVKAGMTSGENGRSMLNGKCVSEETRAKQVPRRSQHLPQVRRTASVVFVGRLFLLMVSQSHSICTVK